MAKTIDVVAEGITDVTELINAKKGILIRAGYCIRVIGNKYVIEKCTEHNKSQNEFKIYAK